MKILHVLPYSPVPPHFGAALRVYNLMRAMTARHDVSVVYFGEEGSGRALNEALGHGLKKVTCVPRPWSRNYRRLNQLYSLINGQSHFSQLASGGEMERAVRRELDGNSFDIVQSEFPHMAAHVQDTDAVMILDAHNVEYDLHLRQWELATNPLRKFFYREEYNKIRREEIRVWNRQDLIFTTSERDRDLILGDVPGVPTVVLPNGVDSGYFSPDGSPGEPCTLVFTGVMKYLPNSDGMRWFLGEIFPLIVKDVPDVKLLVVGSNPPAGLTQYAAHNITFTGRVEDVRPYVNRATISIVPLRLGGGTRLKILESFSMGKPVVSTTIGAEGIEAVHGESIMIADDPRAFADTVVTLLRDEQLRRKLSRNGHETMMEKYEWSVIGSILDRAYAGAGKRGRHHETAHSHA